MLLDENGPERGFSLPQYDVVIPCFNRADTVERAVASLLTQSPPPCRIILVDDGSTDETPARLIAIKQRYPHIHIVLLQRNVGASAARNAGLDLTCADWVAFLDSDDEWAPGAARALLEATPGNDVVVGHFRRAWKSGILDAPECGWNGEDILSALAVAGAVGPSWSLVRRAGAISIGGFDPSYINCNDWDFYVRLAVSGAVFVRIGATIAHYHVAASNRLSLDDANSTINADRVRSNPLLVGQAGVPAESKFLACTLRLSDGQNCGASS